MSKKIFIRFFLICLISPTLLFAENKNQMDNGNFVETESEPYFDLPKKDAKEQCKEVRRVLSSCNDVNKKFRHIQECGNVKIINITSYVRNKHGGYDDDWQNDGRIIVNKNGEYVATTKGTDGYFAINDTNDIPYFIFLKNEIRNAKVS